MKQRAAVWPIVLLLAWSGIGYGQCTSYPTLREVERQTRWLERQDFPARDYRWNNPPVNSTLQSALRANKQANRQLIGGYSLVGIGGAAIVVGCLGMITIATLAPIAGRRCFRRSNSLRGYRWSRLGHFGQWDRYHKKGQKKETTGERKRAVSFVMHISPLTGLFFS